MAVTAFAVATPVRRVMFLLKPWAEKVALFLGTTYVVRLGMRPRYPNVMTSVVTRQFVEKNEPRRQVVTARLSVATVARPLIRT